MRRLLHLGVDLVLVALATLLAALLRYDFNLTPERLIDLGPYLALSLAAAAVLLAAFGSHRSVWRLTALDDYLRLSVIVVATVCSAVVLTFTFNRLEGVARSVPALQGLVMLFAMVGVRVLLRLRHLARGKPTLMSAPIPAGTCETVLVAGLGRLTEAYLKCVAEFAPNGLRIAGLLGRSERDTGRIILGHPVLGTPEQVAAVIQDLDLHGVAVDRIVVTGRLAALSRAARTALGALERSGRTRVDYLPEVMGLSSWSGEPTRDDSLGGPSPETAGVVPPTFTISAAALDAMSRRPYWRVKRALDAVLAALALVAFLPVMIAVAALVAVDLGWPLVFWQQRPGLAGRPFRLYKFRTMGPAHDDGGRRVADAARLSWIGRFLRRTRLDELPQLLNVLAGQMSFVGPRPLLLVDQPSSYAARLLVRPGLTGWAQVGGGREVSAADKAALDVWYVRNASFIRDVEILLRTMPMLIFGEKVDRTRIERTWRDLRRAGICHDGIPASRNVPPQSGHLVAPKTVRNYARH